MLHLAEDPKARHFDTTAVGMSPHMSFPFAATVLEPSPIMKASLMDAMFVIKIEVEAGSVPTKLLFVSFIWVRAPAEKERPKNLV